MSREYERLLCCEAQPARARFSAAGERNYKWNFLQHPDATWSWECVRRHDMSSGERFSSIVQAFDHAEQHGFVSGKSQIGSLGAVEDDDGRGDLH
jgi:hypothetical protein